MPATSLRDDWSRLSESGERLATPCGDGEIVWHRWGRGGEPIVLLHGGSGSWTHWVLNIDALVGAGREVWAPDLPGMGDSALPPGAEDAPDLVEPLMASWDRLLPAGPVDLVGFSFGGMVAGLLAAAHADRVRRLVVVGAPALGLVPRRQADLRAWRHLPAERHDAIHRHNLAALMLEDAGRIDDVVLALHRENVMRDRMGRRRRAHTALLAEALARVPSPVGAIYGEHDVIYRGYEDQIEPTLARSAPDFRGLRWIEGAGHWVQFEQAEAFNATLIEALEAMT
jgi:pimeloyl-ACP methyl ester carboxylesterase